ncbi:hypothetical protein BKI52_04580 [marine bacterium AO1-C]|nr:hypothetical protein BKI52_04580 [marine bacterium AO1-C]
MKQQLTVTIVCIGTLLSFTKKNKTMEIEKIKNTITHNYVHGAFNETNIEAFKHTFHPEFSIINIQENGSFFLFTRDMWIDVLQKRKKDKSFDYSSIALTPKYKHVDITANKASVTLDLLLNDKVVYTDFLLLIKVEDDWKIVSKIYHEH